MQSQTLARPTLNTPAEFSRRRSERGPAQWPVIAFLPARFVFAFLAAIGVHWLSDVGSAILANFVPHAYARALLERGSQHERSHSQ